MKIFVASRNEVFRLGLRRLTEHVLPGADITDAKSTEPLIKGNEWEHYDLLILHKSNRTGDLSKLLEVCNLFLSKIKVLVLSDKAGLTEAKYLFSLGVRGYAESSSSSGSISKAIRQVLSGELYAEASLIIQSFNTHSQHKESAPVSLLKLSTKELEIAGYLVQGLGTNEISKLTNRKATTISTQKSKIFNKLRIRNVVELMHLI